ncbi:phenylphosphate carboxylase subunit delta, partial [Xanthomonas perforans]|nr:phenylphosphate carboxylase subunit delta [Xanthomonas perforans]
MPYSPLQHLPAELIERAARVRLACFDVDGTLTDGRLYY